MNKTKGLFTTSEFGTKPLQTLGGRREKKRASKFMLEKNLQNSETVKGHWEI